MFTNLSSAQNVSAQLLGLFGKNTNILMDVSMHRINVRRANDGALIARLYVSQPSHDVLLLTMVEPDHFVFSTVESLSLQIMAAPKFPQIITKRDRNWSRAVYKEVAGAY